MHDTWRLTKILSDCVVTSRPDKDNTLLSYFYTTLTEIKWIAVKAEVVFRVEVT